jgi:hypothetical protein
LLASGRQLEAIDKQAKTFALMMREAGEEI